MDREMKRVTGALGLAGGVLAIGANVLHPFTDTETYLSGEAFVEHTSDFWVGLHIVVALTLLVVPLVTYAWSQDLTGAAARVVGRLAFYTLLLGTGIGVVHLAGIDGLVLPSYRDLLAGGGDMEVFGADLLLRVHLTTFVSWTLLMFGAGLLLLGLAELASPSGRRILGWLLVVGSALGFASSIGSGLEGHLTTATDAGLLRPAGAIATVWLLLVSWEMWREGVARPEPETAVPEG